jgi:glyoxylase-like metal-dependent hydrolase (beta-lactamase superfamily II)
VQAWVASLESLLRLDFTRVIPGHGETTDRNGMRQFLALIAQLAEIARTAADRGNSLEQTLQTDQLTADEGYEQLDMIIPLHMDREFVITRAWEETTKNFTRLN